MIERKEGTARTPRYLALAEVLRAEVMRGDYGGEQPFPTESTLCARFGVSRFTVREALRALQDERLIERRRGAGTTVQSPARRGGTFNRQLSNFAQIIEYARETSFLFALPGEGALPRRLAEFAGLDAGNPWLRFEGLRYASGQEKPIAFTRGYIHADLREAAHGLEHKEMALFRQLELLGGVRFVTILQDITSVLAGRSLAASLDVTPRSPCLRVRRCYLDARDCILVISESTHPSDRFAYAMRIDVG